MNSDSTTTPNEVLELEFNSNFAYFTRSKKQVYLSSFVNSPSISFPFRGYLGENMPSIQDSGKEQDRKYFDWMRNGEHSFEENEFDIIYKIPYPENVVIDLGKEYITKLGRRVELEGTIPEDELEMYYEHIHDYPVKGTILNDDRDARSLEFWNMKGETPSKNNRSNDIVPIGWELEILNNL